MSDNNLSDCEIVELAKDGCGCLSEEGFDRLIALARKGAADKPVIEGGDVPEGYVKRLEAELMKSNDALRSAYQVCCREGLNTSWEAFTAMVQDALKTAHEIVPLIRSGADRALSPALVKEGVGNLPKVLFEHFLSSIVCDPIAKTDTANCACSMVQLPAMPSIGDAVKSWIAHVMEQVNKNLPAVVKEGVVVPLDVVKYLRGEGTLEGQWFDSGIDRYDEQGHMTRFWWRRYLPPAPVSVQEQKT